MKQQRYFFKFSHSYVQKNKLYASFCRYMEGLDGTLVIGKESREIFLKMIRRKHELLCQEHHRCKPTVLEMFTASKTGIYVSGSFHSDLFQVKGDFVISHY